MKKTTTEMKLVALDKLIPYANNARTHSPDQINKLRSSIREFGFINPIIIDRDYGVIAGHGRITAAREEGITELPCVFADHLTEAQKKAYIIADNRMALDAGWDEEILRVEIESLSEMAFDLSFTGFDADELSKLFDGEKEIQDDDFDVDAELQKPTITKQGDVWLLGRHRLVCGDSASGADVRRLMNGEKARFVFTDPPWNVNYGADAGHPGWKPRQILNDKMSTEEFGEFLLRVFGCMKEASEPGCMTYVVMSAQEWGNLMNVMRQTGYHWSSTIIWAKDSLVLSRKDYHTQYEPIWYGWLDGEKRLCPLQDRKQSDVWEIPRPKVSVEHPTMKPVSLVAKAIVNSSRAGDLVLDLFGGSGTTIIAAQQTGRICCAMELDPKYCDVIVNRYIKETDSTEVFLERSGETLRYVDVPGNFLSK